MSGAAEVAEPLADKEELLMLLLQKGGCVRGDVISRGEVDEVLGDPPRIDDMLFGLKLEIPVAASPEIHQLFLRGERRGYLLVNNRSRLIIEIHA